MTGRTHDLAAFTALVIALLYLPQLPIISLATAITAFGMNFVGGLFPDIDQPTSDFWDNFRLGPIVAKVVCPALGGHRHISHSLLGLALFGFGSHFLFQLLAPIILINMTVVWYAFMIGILSHFVMDFVTKEGLPLLWPLCWKFGFPPFKFMRIETGGFIERVIIFPGLLVLTAYLMYHNQIKLLELLHHSIR